MTMVNLRRSTILASNKFRTSVQVGGYDVHCYDGPSSIKAQVQSEVEDHFRNYFRAKIRDYGLKGDSWKRVDGTLTTDPWEAPEAHRIFFNARLNGEGDCLSYDHVWNLLADIGVDQEVCGQSVVDALLHLMDKSGHNCTTWPEYLNSRFAVGPASDSKAPDPTDPGASTGIMAYFVGPKEPDTQLISSRFLDDKKSADIRANELRLVGINLGIAAIVAAFIWA